MTHRRWPADPESVEGYAMAQIAKLEAQLRLEESARLVIYLETGGDFAAAIVTRDHRQLARINGASLAGALVMLSTPSARTGISEEPVMTAADPRVVAAGVVRMDRK